MAKQAISIGTVANDGTGDTLRSAGSKVNANFDEIYTQFGDGNALTSGLQFSSNGIIFEGSVPDNNETTLMVENPTADHTAVIPNYTGAILMDSATQTVANKRIVRPEIDSAQLNGLLIKDRDSSHDYNIISGSLASDVNVTLPNISADDQFTFNDATQELTNKTLYRPRVEQMISDSVGEPMLEFLRSGTSSHVKITNDDNPIIQANTSLTNAHLNIDGAGTGSVELNKLALNTIEISSGGDTVGAPVTNSGLATFEPAGHIRGDKATSLYIQQHNGTLNGETKVYTNGGAGNIEIAFPTANNFAQGTSITIHPNGAAQLIWSDDRWFIMGGLDSDHNGNRLLTINA